MTWIKFLEQARKKAEIQAKGKAELKPRHVKRLREIWKDKYLAKKNYSLNCVFEVTYSETINVAVKEQNPILKLMKTNHNFYSNPIELKLGK